MLSDTWLAEALLLRFYGVDVIRQIKVNGFRTLSDFNLKLAPGLNLLLGPNGGGKTTIITFLSFINDLHATNLSNAVSNVGGAGYIFRKKGARDYERTITAEISGTVEIIRLDMFSDRVQTEKFGKFIDYKYTFSIKLSDDREDVYYDSQELYLRRSSVEAKNPDKIKNWDFVFSRKLSPEGEFHSNAQQARGDASERYEIRFVRGGDLSAAFDDVVAVDDSILHVTRILGSDVRNSFARNFGRRVLYNPQPDQIRKPEDSAKSPGIRPDGSGLYASLLAIKKRRSSRAIRRYQAPVRDEIPFNRTIPLDDLLERFKLAFPALHSIDVNNDPFDNQIRARVTLDSREGPQLPLAALSDGTLKWMSLATALLTTRRIIGIEEPENFIHPAVQQHALKLIRDQTPDDSFVLVSSHSHSIVDAAFPEEIVFVYLKDSKTVTHRIKNPERIKKLVDETGFGMSTFYTSGALAHA